MYILSIHLYCFCVYLPLLDGRRAQIWVNWSFQFAYIMILISKKADSLEQHTSVPMHSNSIAFMDITVDADSC